MGRWPSIVTPNTEFQEGTLHQLTASWAINTIDALADFDLAGVKSIIVENRTAAVVKIEFSATSAIVYIYPGDKFVSWRSNFSGTLSFSGYAGTNLGAASNGISPYIQIIASKK